MRKGTLINANGRKPKLGGETEDRKGKTYPSSSRRRRMESREGNPILKILCVLYLLLLLESD